MSDAIRKHSVVIAGHRTSVSIEPAFWDALRDLAARRNLTLNKLVEEIDAARRGNLSSAIRLAVLRDLQTRTSASDAG